MDDDKRIAAIVKKVSPDGITLEVGQNYIKVPLTSLEYKEGQKVFIRIFSEAEEKMTKEEIAKAILTEVIKDAKEN